MNLKLPKYHILFWIVVIAFLILVFGHSWESNAVAFIYISCLLPVIMSTSYFFNYFLVTKYLIKKRYYKFTLYLIYTIIVSLFLEMMIIIFTFTILVEFNYSDFNPKARDMLFLASAMYLIVFAGSFLLMLQQIRIHQSELQTFKLEEQKRTQATIQVMSNRKTAQIPLDEITFIESFSDHIKINTNNKNTIDSKEKISKIAAQLPNNFLRIHRSFVVNRDKVISFSYNEVQLQNATLTIGRTYKPKVLSLLKKRTPLTKAT